MLFQLEWSIFIEQKLGAQVEVLCGHHKNGPKVFSMKHPVAPLHSAVQRNEYIFFACKALIALGCDYEGCV